MATRVEIEASFNHALDVVESGGATGKFEVHRPDPRGGLLRLPATPLTNPESLIREFLEKLRTAAAVVVKGDEKIETLNLSIAGGKVKLLIETIKSDDIAEIERLEGKK